MASTSRDFLDGQAEESENSGTDSGSASGSGSDSGGEPDSKKRKVEKKKRKEKKTKKGRKKKIDSSDEDEDDEEEDARAREEMKGFIEDEEEEEEDRGSEKSDKNEEEDDELDEDDLDLIDENIGVQRKKRVIQPDDSDEEDDRTRIQRNLFADGDDDEEGSERRPSARGEYDEDRGNYSDSGQSEDDGFIVHEGGAPRRRTHHRKDIGVDGHALDEARDVFGVDDFNFDEFYEEGEDGEEILEDEEDLDDEERAEGEPRVRVIRRKEKKATLLDTLEPSELDRGYLSAADKKIVLEDKPERFLLRRTAVTEADDNELDREAQWIWSYAFDPDRGARTISQQESTELFALKNARDGEYGENEQMRHVRGRAPAVIREVLKFIRNQSFEVPFIAFYRKEVLEKMLELAEQWKVYEWDEKWCHLQSRKQKLLDLMKRMHSYQTDTELMVRRPLPESDMYDVEAVETVEQLNDVSAQFHMYYGNELNKMVDWEKSKQLEEDPEAEVFAPRFKMSSRNDKYLLCVENGLAELSARFGLSARAFAENLDYRKNEVEQDPVSPRVAAADYCTTVFPDADKALQGAMYMLAREIARQPKVRDRVRTEYRRLVRMVCKPTKLGREQIDEAHPLYKKRYLSGKPVWELQNDEFLYFDTARKAGLLEYSFSCESRMKGDGIVDILLQDQPFYKDLHDDVTTEWNRLRADIVRMSVDEMVVPSLEKEMVEKLREEAKAHVVQKVQNYIYSKIDMGPFRPTNILERDDDDEDEEHTTRILSLCYALERDEVSFGALVDQDGVVVDYVRLPHFIKRANLRNPNKANQDCRLKLEDVERLRKFIIRRRPHLIVVAGENMDAKGHKYDVEFLARDMIEKKEIYRMPEIVIMDNEAPKVYMYSKMGTMEYPEYPPLLRQAVSLARTAADPLLELAHLCNQDDDIYCLAMHPLQAELGKDDIAWACTIEFINRVNEVGVDVNRCLEHPHTTNVLQFVCGLGPRKSAHMLKTLKQNDNLLEARAKLVMLCRMGPKVFMNCAGFIKINTEKVSERTDQYVEILDGSRVHPETYEWARKMAVDALEFDDSGDPTAALEEILSSPEKLRDLDLDAFADELFRQGFGNKHDTLYDIRRELSSRYEDWRKPFAGPTDKGLFKMLTKESKETLSEGKLVLGKVLMVVHKRLTDEQLERKVPMRDETTNQWVCQWCHMTNFPSVGELYAHLDDNLCPGQPVGIKVKLDNGLLGFVPNKLLSDNPESFKNPLERVKIGQPVYCRVKSVNPEKFAVDLSCRTSDLRNDAQGGRDMDPYFDMEAAETDLANDNQAKEKQKVASAFVKRVISHPAFKNVTYREAERLLSKAEQGDAVIRPSSKSAMNLTVTWKVTDNVYAHVDVNEEGKDKEFQLGKILKIGDESYEDLDEILARYVQPMASFAREIAQHKYYMPEVVWEDRSQLDAKLHEEKRMAPSRIPYVFAPSGDYPGKFLLSYLARVRPKHEYMTVTDKGVRFRNEHFGSLDTLLNWFKKHYRDPPPTANANAYRSRPKQDFA